MVQTWQRLNGAGDRAVHPAPGPQTLNEDLKWCPCVTRRLQPTSEHLKWSGAAVELVEGQETIQVERYCKKNIMPSSNNETVEP